MEQTSAISLLRGEARQEIVNRLFAAQNSLCYICSKIINLQVQATDIDHIIALTHGGPDNESNWGLAHSACNRSKGARDLRLQRILYQFASHVDKHTNPGNGGTGNFTLHEALQELAPKRQQVGWRLCDGQIQVSWNEDGKPVTECYPLLKEDSRPEAHSFVAMLPFSCLHHDSDVNPRSIVDLEPMIEEFYSGNPQLQPSLATLKADGDASTGTILVFDGQHKAAAQLYACKKRLLVRVFVNYDTNRLKETNYRAHTKLAQVHFPQLINDRVGADLFQERFERFARDADRAKVSEESFFRPLPKAQRSEFRQYFQNYLRYEVLTGKAGTCDNEILKFTETVTARSLRFPLSYDTLQHTFLQHYLMLRPTREVLDESENFRRLERGNLVRLMNLFVEEVLAGDRFDLRLGIRRLEDQLMANAEKISDSHLRAYRLCRKPAMIVWTQELAGAIALLLGTRQRYKFGAWGSERPLWAELNEEDWTTVRRMIRAIRDHKIWGERTNPDLLQAISATRQKNWAEMLLQGTLPGRQGKCLPELNQNFIFTSAVKS